MVYAESEPLKRPKLRQLRLAQDMKFAQDERPSIFPGSQLKKLDYNPPEPKPQRKYTLVSQKIARKSAPVETGRYYDPPRGSKVTYRERMIKCMLNSPSVQHCRQHGIIRVIFSDGHVEFRTFVPRQMKTNLHFGPDGILTILIAEKKSWFDFWTFFADSVKPLWHQIRKNRFPLAGSSSMKNIYAGLRKVGLSYDSWHDSLLDRTLGFSRCNMEFEDYLPCLLNEVAYLDLETKFTTLEK